ncbi:hypothetical protein MRX96_028913 [Rhipicephalus microplus]
MEPPQKRFRFTIETDIYMLREMRQQQQICCCQSMRMDLSEPPHREDGTAGDSTTTSPAGEVPAVAPGVPAAAPGVRLFRGNAFAPASVTDFYPDLLSD